MTVDRALRTRPSASGVDELATSRRLRMGQLPSLAGVERQHKQGGRLALSRRIRNDQTTAVRAPGKVRRKDEVRVVYENLGYFALRSAQWRDQAQFTRAGLPFTAQEGDPTTVWRSDRIVVDAGIHSEPQRRTGADLLYVDVLIVLLWAGPITARLFN